MAVFACLLRQLEPFWSLSLSSSILRARGETAEERRPAGALRRHRIAGAPIRVVAHAIARGTRPCRVDPGEADRRGFHVLRLTGCRGFAVQWSVYVARCSQVVSSGSRRAGPPGRPCGRPGWTLRAGRSGSASRPYYSTLYVEYLPFLFFVVKRVPGGFSRLNFLICSGVSKRVGMSFARKVLMACSSRPYFSGRIPCAKAHSACAWNHSSAESIPRMRF